MNSAVVELGAAPVHDCNMHINISSCKEGAEATITAGVEPGCGCGGGYRTIRLTACDFVQLVGTVCRPFSSLQPVGYWVISGLPCGPGVGGAFSS